MVQPPVPYRTPCPPAEPGTADAVASFRRGRPWMWLLASGLGLLLGGGALVGMSCHATEDHGRLAHSALQRSRCEQAREAARQAWSRHRGFYWRALEQDRTVWVEDRYAPCAWAITYHPGCPPTRSDEMKAAIVTATNAPPERAWRAARDVRRPSKHGRRYRSGLRSLASYQLARARSWYAYLACTKGALEVTPPSLEVPSPSTSREHSAPNAHGRHAPAM